MDCHLNCHGELNMLLLGFPFVLGFMRAVWRKIGQWLRELNLRNLPAVSNGRDPEAGAYRTADRPPEEPKAKRYLWLCRDCYAAAVGGCPHTCIRQAETATNGKATKDLGAQLRCDHGAGDEDHDGHDHAHGEP